MRDLNLYEIYDAYKGNQIDKSLTVEKLIFLLEKGENKDSKIKFAEFLIDIYHLNDEKSKELIRLMAEKIGNYYIENYQIEPIEAIGLKLLESVSNDEIFFTRSGLDGHSYITFYLENSHVSEIYVKNCFPDLKVLELFSKIKELHIDDHESYYFNFDGLSKLTNLEVLILDLIGLNNIEDLHGLANLINLRELQILSTSIAKIKFLSQLRKLEKLSIAGEINYFFHSEISEIEGLENLVKLKELNLYSNKIAEIKELDELINLEILDLGGNRISEIKGLDKLINLKKLNLSENNISKIRGLDSLSNLEFLNLYGNSINKIDGLNNLINLKFLDLRNNKIKNIDGLENLINLTSLHLQENDIINYEEFDFSGSSMGVHYPEKFVEYCRQKTYNKDLLDLATSEILEMYKNKKLHKHLWKSIVSILEQRGESDNLHSFYELVVNIFPDQLSVWKILTSIYQAEENIDKLIDAYEHIVVINRNNHKVLNKLLSLYEYIGDPDKILDTYKRIVDAFPLEPKGWFDLANQYFKIESYHDALDAINQTLKVDPRFRAAIKLRNDIIESIEKKRNFKINLVSKK